jgi:hypothetical protein
MLPLVSIWKERRCMMGVRKMKEDEARRTGGRKTKQVGIHDEGRMVREGRKEDGRWRVTSW